MPSIAQMQSFRSVVATGSVRSAARHLGLSASAVSHHVRQLEDDAGITLFARHGRGLRLTEVGLAFLPDIDAVLASSSRLQQRIGELRRNRIDRLSIGYFATAGTRWLPDLVAFLENRFPHTAVQLNLAEGPWDEARSDLQIVIFDSRHPNLPSQVDCAFLAEDPYVAAVPDDHPLADRVAVGLVELTDSPWIDNDSPDGACRAILENACARAGIPVRFTHEANDYDTALHMVARGLGVTILPRLRTESVPAGVRILRLSAPEPIRYIHALSDRDHPQQHIIADAVAAMRDLAREDGAW